MGKTWINHNGVWKESYPKVNHNGIWKPSKPWVNHYGVWKKAFIDMTLYTPCVDKYVYGIDPENGNIISSFLHHDNQVYCVESDPYGYLYSGSRDDTICKFDLNGNILWQIGYGFGNVDQISYCPFDGFLYAGFEFGKVSKINPATGSVIWTNYDLNDGIYGTIVFDKNGCLYTGGSNGKLCKINRSDGSLIWSISYSDSLRSIEINRINYEYIYVGGLDNITRRYDLDGTKIWDINYGYGNVDSIHHCPYDGYLYIGFQGGYFLKANPYTGDVVWERRIFGYYVRGIISDPYGYIYSGSYDDTIKKINPSNGDVIWSINIDICNHNMHKMAIFGI